KVYMLCRNLVLGFGNGYQPVAGFNYGACRKDRVKKAFAFDKMFAVIFLISAISLVLMALVELAEKKCMPYRHPQKRKKEKKV
ncbi:MAG: hypothetical protein II350_01920, partial [Clostridia bacterium]|nr:hypothetical protein [Clostridia bacterium]